MKKQLLICTNSRIAIQATILQIVSLPIPQQRLVQMVEPFQKEEDSHLYWTHALSYFNLGKKVVICFPTRPVSDAEESILKTMSDVGIQRFNPSNTNLQTFFGAQK